MIVLRHVTRNRAAIEVLEHPSEEKEKEKKSKKTLHPEGHTPPFRRLSCGYVCSSQVLTALALGPVRFLRDPACQCFCRPLCWAFLQPPPLFVPRLTLAQFGPFSGLGRCGPHR